MSDDPLEDALYSGYEPSEAARPAGPASEDPTPGPPLPEFDPRWRDEFAGLLYLGALAKEFTWLGHRFKIRTLRSGELVATSLITKRYAETDGYLKACQGAIVAACVVSADGRPLPGVPLLSDAGAEGVLETNFQYVMDRWFPPVLDRVYQEYIELELLVRRVLEAMGKASG